MSILKRLGSKEVLIPHLEQSILAENWPENYTVTIDSSPYYGKMTADGEILPAGSGDGYFHPSSALECQRSLFVSFHPRLQHLRPVLRKDMNFYMTVNFGTAIHGMMQTQLEMAGLLVPGTVEYEYACDVHNVRGRIDAVVQPPGRGEIVLDIKTMNSRGFGFLKSHDPKKEWEAQVNLGMAHYGVREGLILVVEAGYPWGLKEVPIKYNDALLNDLYSKWERVITAIERDTPPDCTCEQECWAGQLTDRDLVVAA